MNDARSSEPCSRCGRPTHALTAPDGDDDELLCKLCVVSLWTAAWHAGSSDA